MSDALLSPSERFGAALIVGRGESAEGFWARYDSGFYVLGVNPGASPRQGDAIADPCDKRFSDCLGRFTGIASANTHYAGWIMRQPYKGDLFIDLASGFSFGLACKVVTRLGFKRVVLAGIDCVTSRYSAMRPTVLGHVDWMRAMGVSVWRDPLCYFKGLAEAYDAGV